MSGLYRNTIARRLSVSVWVIGLLLMFGLYGNPITRRSTIIYKCPVGPHFVNLEDVMKRDVAGRPLCPIHLKPMTASNT